MRAWVARLAPAIASERFFLLEDGNVYYQFRRPYSDGTRGVVLQPASFIQRLVALVPPAKTHSLHYYGVLAPRSRFRRQVVVSNHWRRDAKGKQKARTVRTRLSYEDLLLRGLGIRLQCSRCGGRSWVRQLVLSAQAAYWLERMERKAKQVVLLPYATAGPPMS